MRSALITVAALAVLGLGAFVVSAQRGPAPPSEAVKPTPMAATSTPRAPSTPVQQIAQAAETPAAVAPAPSRSEAPSTAPVRLAQDNPAPAVLAGAGAGGVA